MKGAGNPALFSLEKKTVIKWIFNRIFWRQMAELDSKYISLNEQNAALFHRMAALESDIKGKSM